MLVILHDAREQAHGKEFFLRVLALCVLAASFLRTGHALVFMAGDHAFILLKAQASVAVLAHVGVGEACRAPRFLCISVALHHGVQLGLRLRDAQGGAHLAQENGVRWRVQVVLPLRTLALMHH